MTPFASPSPLTPHGPGFRFVDQFTLAPAGTNRGSATFYLHPALPFFADHFPGNPIMPAALLMEHAAQAAGVLWMSLEKQDSLPDTPLFLAGADSLRFLGPAQPETTLSTEVERIKEFGSLAQFQFETHSGEAVISRGRLTLSRQLKT